MVELVESRLGVSVTDINLWCYDRDGICCTVSIDQSDNEHILKILSEDESSNTLVLFYEIKSNKITGFFKNK